MGSFANTVFSMMLSWVRSAVSGIWNLFTSSDGNSLLTWIGAHWVKIVVILCIVGTITDIVIHLFRWRPLTVWASFFRRLRHHRTDEDELVQDRPSRPRQKRVSPQVQRQLVYADGNTEVIDTDDWHEDASDGMNDFDQTPYPAYTEPAPTVANMSHTQYRRDSYATAAPVGLEDYPQARRASVFPAAEEVPPEPISRDAVEIPEDTRRSRKMLRRVAELPKTIWQSDDDDELQLRYQPAKPAVDKDAAYHAPVYPPAWKNPEGKHRKQEQ